MPPLLKQVLDFVLPLIRPRAGYWIAKTLVAAGVASVVLPWWLPVLEGLLNKTFGFSAVSPSVTIIGFVLISLGLGVFIFERVIDLRATPGDVMPEIKALAHFAILVHQPDVQRCFVKIANSSPTKSVTVTHVDYVGSSIVPLLGTPLPRTLGPSEMFEVHIPVSALLDGANEDVLTRFRITDSLGRKHVSKGNRDVSPVGYVG